MFASDVASIKRSFHFINVHRRDEDIVGDGRQDTVREEERTRLISIVVST